MKKKKVLFVTEANFHPTGYSVYTKEVLSRLSKIESLEVAELAAFVSPSDPQIKNVKWKFYANMPDESNQALMQQYNSSATNKFGDFSFNRVLLDFMPDFVMDIRDWWMLEFEQRSPFRRFYNWAIMPTVDAEPQNWQWIDTYSDADGVFAYSEFGRDTMLNQSNKIKFVDVASPCASTKFFKIVDKKSLRKQLRVPEDAIVFGTVMRNQRRKLYPDLLKSFRQFLDNNPGVNAYLYLHTSFPDVGWDIPELIKTNNLGGKVLLTYKCKKCNSIVALPFSEAVCACQVCGTMSNLTVGINNKMDDCDLNYVYNLFDVYIQWANSEGWGMPQLEAAYAGLPVISVDYSAMSSLVHNINGIPIKPIGFYKELETGCMRAVPDNENLVTQMECMLNKPFRDSVAQSCHDNARKIYNWDYTADKWAKYFLNTEVADHSLTWKSPPRYFNPAKGVPEQLKQMITRDQVNWLFINVLGRPELIHGPMWKRMMRDLTYQSHTTSHIAGYYYNDYSHPDMEKRHEPFDVEKAFYHLSAIANLNNEWENERVKRIQSL